MSQTCGRRLRLSDSSFRLHPFAVDPLEYSSKEFETQERVHVGNWLFVSRAQPGPVGQWNGPRPAPVALSTVPAGKQVALAALGDCIGADALAACKRSRAVVVVFVGTECPLAQRYLPRLVELDKNYRGRQVEFLAIDSNQQDSLAEIAHFAESNKVDFPVKKDPGNKVADLFGATRTPEAFVLDREGVIRYAGLIDDQFGVGYAHDKPKRRYVDDALGDVLAGAQCACRRPNQLAAASVGSIAAHRRAT